jgi:hypothetical protein
MLEVHVLRPALVIGGQKGRLHSREHWRGNLTTGPPPTVPRRLIGRLSAIRSIVWLGGNATTAYTPLAPTSGHKFVPACG